jgi:glycosyltransferase involved in cell wall biosynthesis
MRILFLSRWFPFPADNGSRIRVFNAIRQIALCHEINLLSFTDSASVADDEALRELRKYCVHIRCIPHQEFRPASPRAICGLFQPRPRWLVDTFSPDMQDAAIEEAQSCDVIIASQLDMAPYVEAIPGVPALLEELELGSFASSRNDQGTILGRGRSHLTWLKLAAYVRQMLPRFALCTVVSERERSHVGAIAPGYQAVRVIPNTIDVSHYEGDFGRARPDTLVYCGALTYGANLDAMRHYLNEIDPAVTSEAPYRVLRVTGSTTGIALRSLPFRDGVRYTGYVDDIRPVVAQSWASIVPIRAGGGTRLKILESMALGTPVITTSKGAEGLDHLVDGENILIADEPREFAAKVTLLLRSPALRQRLADGGRQLVAAHYDWQAAGRELRSLVGQLAA